MPLEEGKIYDGVVSSIAAFGIFVQLPEGKTGLVHISEIADSYVKDIKEHIKEKQEIRVKVLTIGNDGKINLSIRQAKDPKAVQKPAEVNWSVEVKKQVVGSFEDKLSKFLKESEEITSAVKKQEGNRRGNTHRKK